MIRRSFHPLIVTSLAALTLAGCSDDVTPTAVTPNAAPPRRASPTLFTSNNVTYPILHGTVRFFDTEIKSVDGVPLAPGSLKATVPSGATIRVTGKWEIGPITNVDECQLCSYSVYVAWPAGVGATPLNRGLVTMTSPALNPAAGATGTFDWTTDAPQGNRPRAINAAQSVGSTFDDDVGAQSFGTSPDAPGAIFALFWFDVEGPEISAPVVSGTLGDNGWYTSDVTVSWEVIASSFFPTTGKTGCDPVTISSDVTNMALTCSVISRLGTAKRSVTINRDATKPTITRNGVTPAANAAGWNKSDVTATWTCNDAGSGVANASVSQTVATDGANQSATGNCVDKAGNTATDARAGINLDKTPPSLSPLVSPSTVAFKSTATASPNASDALSGIAGTPSCGAVVTSLAGTFTVDCTATDKAGNTATERAIYTVTGYTFAGFLAPVDPAPTWNTAKAGSAIPVIFSLRGDQGLDILAAGSPKWQPTACPASASVDAIEETVIAAGGTSLTYDAKTDQYKYVWKTAKAWGGTCGDLILMLADGSAYSARFQFTK